ncbi:MAG: Gfo/Idh/MocA family oxidoreductase [Planctomycetota bacterium]|jgi:predicted dehydrogenase
MSLGIGIVGIGKHGMRYGRHLMAGEVEGAHLVAVQRRTNARGLEAAAELGCSYLPTIEDLCLHERIGALIIASPPDAHVEAVRMAVQAGKACLIEKPLARTVAEAEELLAVTQAPGAPLCAVAHPLRWNAVVREVRERLPELGVLRSLWVALRHKAPEERSWRLDPKVAGGGVGLDYGTHLFDLVRWLTGAEITAVRADVGRSTDAAVESHLQALLTLHGAASDGGAVRVQVEGADRRLPARHPAQGVRQGGVGSGAAGPAGAADRPDRRLRAGGGRGRRTGPAGGGRRSGRSPRGPSVLSFRGGRRGREAGGGGVLTIRVRRQGEAGEERREFASESVSIGRHPDNDLVLAESTVSRQHARIELKNGRYHIIDLGSAHGIYIDKQRVQDQPLPEECELYVNPFVLHVTTPAPSATDATEPPPADGPAAAPEEALHTLPTSGGSGSEPTAPPAPIELDIEDEDDADLPALDAGDDGGLMPVEQGADEPLMEVGESGEVAIADVAIADVAEVAEVARAAAEPPENTPDNAPDNIVGTIFEINAGPPKTAAAAGETPPDRPTAELESPPDPPTGEFHSSIEVEDNAAGGTDDPPSSEMLMAPATAALPAGKQPQAIDEGTVLEYSAKDVHAYADQVDAAAAAAAADDAPPLETLPQRGSGEVPRTRAHISGPAAGPAAKATPELQERAEDLLAGREHGRLIATLLGAALIVLTLVPASGGAIPLLTGAGGIVWAVWIAAAAGGAVAIAGSWLIPGARGRGILLAIAGGVPLLLLLATFDAQEVVRWLDATQLAEGAVPLKRRAGVRVLLGWGEHAPFAPWLLAIGAVLLAGAARAARTWPEGVFSRVAAPLGGCCLLATGLLAATPDGPIPFAGLARGGAGALVLFTVPLAGAAGLLLAAGKGRVFTFAPAALLAIGLCSPAIIHLSRVTPLTIAQARLALLPVPMVFLAATGVAVTAIAVMTRARPDAQALLDRL